MRITLMADTYPPENRGGAGVVVERLAGAFVRRGHEVSVLATSRRMESDVEQDGVRVRRLWSRYPERFRNLVAMANPLVSGGVRNALEEFRPDVIHAHNVHQHLSFAALGSARDTVAPVAYTAHDFLINVLI